MYGKVKEFTASNWSQVRTFAMAAPAALVVGAVAFVGVGVAVGRMYGKK